MSSMVQRLPRAFPRGDSFQLPFQVQDTATGAAVNITGWTFTAHLRDVNDTLLQSFTCTITDAPTGWVAVTATPAQTINWPLGYHTMNIKIVDANGDVSSSMVIQVHVEEGPTHV